MAEPPPVPAAGFATGPAAAAPAMLEYEDEDGDDLMAAPPVVSEVAAVRSALVGQTASAPPAPPPASVPLSDDTGSVEDPARPRRSLDEAVLSVLREEAERELRSRQTEKAPLETQADLGLTSPPPARVLHDPNAARLAMLRGEEDLQVSAPDIEPRLAADAEAAKRTSRRDLLPDIEEINSTLRSTSDRSRSKITPPTELDIPKPRSGGFRFGFSLIITLGLLLMVVYAFAPRIIEQVPALESPLNAYKAGVDAGRLWLDEQMKAMLAKLKDPAP